MLQSGSFLIVICVHIFLLTVIRRIVSQQLPDEEYMKGRVPSERPLPDEIGEEEQQREMIMMSAADIIHGSNPMLWRTADIRMRSDQCVSFEVGFVFKTMEETFRRMLDLYNTTLDIRRNITEPGYIHHVMYLQKMEKLHWRVLHLHNMMHEIERKYKMDALINGSGVFEDGKRWTRFTADTRKTWTFTWGKSTTSWWYPLEHGWTDQYYVWK